MFEEVFFRKSSENISVLGRVLPKEQLTVNTIINTIKHEIAEFFKGK